MMLDELFFIIFSSRKLLVSTSTPERSHRFPLEIHYTRKNFEASKLLAQSAIVRARGKTKHEIHSSPSSIMQAERKTRWKSGPGEWSDGENFFVSHHFKLQQKARKSFKSFSSLFSMEKMHSKRKDDE